jgi:hypothetical protein
MVRPPEVRSLTRLRPMLVRHIVLSIFKIEDENRSGSLAAEQLCEKWTLTFIRAASLFCRDNSLFRGKNSLFHPVGNFAPKRLKSRTQMTSESIFEVDFHQIPCSFPC